jgi:hypothetical protein
MVAGVLNYLYVLLLTHRLPPDLYARFAASQALLLVAGTVANVTVPWTLARQLRRPLAEDAKSRAIRQAFRINCALGAVFAVASAGIAARFLTPAGLCVVAASAFAFFLASTAMGYAQGQARFRMLALLVAGEVAVKVVVGLVLVASGSGVVGAIGANAVGALVVLLAGVLVALPNLRHSPTVTSTVITGPAHSLWRPSVAMAGIQGLATVATVFNAVLILAVLPAGRGIAAYQLADTVGRVPVFLALALATVVFPALHPELRTRDKARLVGRGLRGLLILAGTVWCGLATVPPALVRAVAPPAYLATVHLLPITTASGVAWAVVVYLASCLRSEGRARPACIGIVALLTADGVLLAITRHHLDATRVASLELAVAALSVGVVTWIAVHSWGRGVVRRSYPALGLIAGYGLLVLSRDHPVVWVTVAVALGGAALVTALPDRLRARPVLEDDAAR